MVSGIQKREVLTAPATPEGFSELARTWRERCWDLEMWTIHTFLKKGVWYVSVTLLKKGGEKDAIPNGS